MTYHARYVTKPDHIIITLIWRSDYRTITLEESVIPGVTDADVSAAGEQTISYEFSNLGSLLQRIDRYGTVRLVTSGRSTDLT